MIVINSKQRASLKRMPSVSFYLKDIFKPVSKIACLLEIFLAKIEPNFNEYFKGRSYVKLQKSQCRT